MANRPKVLDSRRIRSPPVPLPREILRLDIVDALRARFRLPVVAVVAGAGWGKTTALAQAVRSNSTSPLGIDAWVSCEPADEDDQRLTAAILDAMGATWPDGSPPVDAIVEAIVSFAPVDLCLVLDDLHRIPEGSGGERLVAQVLEAAPRNGHLVLSSRRRPSPALARRRASGEVLDLGSDDLVFSVDELATLAVVSGAPPVGRPDLGGWPALVALSLATGAGAATEYLWEEIVAALSAEDRHALLAMITLGFGAFEDASSVAAHPDIIPGRIGQLVHAVPLVSGDPAAEFFGVHDLWIERSAGLFAADEIASVQANSLALLAAQEKVLRLGSSALEWGDEDAILTAARMLVGNTLFQLPVETAERWLSRSPRHLMDEPELRLLALAVEVATRPTDPAVDSLADEVLASFVDRGDVEGSVSAGSLAMSAAHRRSDLGRVLAVTEQIRSLPDGEAIPIVSVSLQVADALMAYLQGRFDNALDVVRAIEVDVLPTLLGDFVRLVQINLLLEFGEGEEAARVASTIEHEDSLPAIVGAFIRWEAGQPVFPPTDLADLDVLDDRSQFIYCAETASIAASLGLPDLARKARGELVRSVGPAGGVRYSGVAAAVIAKTFVLEYDEDAARSVINEHFVHYPPDDPISDIQLRRHLATVYVLFDDLAARWDSVQLGEIHRGARQAGRLIRQVRSGRLAAGTVIEDPDLVVTCLPLPWTIELLVAARRDRIPGAPALLEVLSRYALGPTRAELEQLSGHAGPTASTARDLLSELPQGDDPSLRIAVLGPMSISLDGRILEPAELRRRRVRTVLTLLIVRGPMRRDELIELVWPDHDRRKGRQNLRATLSRVRRLLQSGGSGTGPSGWLRTEGDTVALAGPSMLTTDLWELRELLADAATGGGSGGTGPIEALRRAVSLWRGNPVADLEAVAGTEADIEEIRSELVESCHRLGELLITVGHFEEAIRCADRTRVDAPYSERAHRLALSALLHLGDRDRLQRRMSALEAMLEDFGVGPAPSTTMLLNRAAEILGVRAVP